MTGQRGGVPQQTQPVGTPVVDGDDELATCLVQRHPHEWTVVAEGLIGEAAEDAVALLGRVELEGRRAAQVGVLSMQRRRPSRGVPCLEAVRQGETDDDAPGHAGVAVQTDDEACPVHCGVSRHCGHRLRQACRQPRL